MTEHISDLEQPWDMGPDDYSPEEKAYDESNPKPVVETDEVPF